MVWIAREGQKVKSILNLGMMAPVADVTWYQSPTMPSHLPAFILFCSFSFVLTPAV
jgi:hypothetical protein